MTTVRKISIGTGKDYANLEAFVNYLGTQDLVSNNERIEAEIYENYTITNYLIAAPLLSDSTRYCIIKPAPGLGVNDLETTTFNYGTQGIEINFGYGQLLIGRGVVLSGLRFLRIVGSSDNGIVISNSVGGAGPSQKIIKCRIKNLSTNGNSAAVSTGNNGAVGIISDNLFIQDGATNPGVVTSWDCSILRNTFVGLNSATGAGLYKGYFGGMGIVLDNAFIDLSNPIFVLESAQTISNNYSNTPLASGSIATGITISSSPSLVVSSTDFRPFTTGALYNNASASANGATDILGVNRGLDPDVGAWQQSTVVPSATTIVITGPTTGTTGTQTGNFTVSTDYSIAGTIVVTPTSTFGGSFSPATVSLTSGTPTATFKYTPSYMGVKTISTTNDQGLAAGTAVSINVASSPATAVLITSPSVGQVGVASSNFSLSIAGDITGTVTITPSEASGGTFTPSTVSLTSASSTGTFTYTPTTSGEKAITISNNQGLTNPTVNAFYVNEAAVAVPGVSSGNTVVVSVGAGKDYSTLNAFATFINSYDLVANSKIYIAEVYDNFSGTVSITPVTFDADHYVIIRPVKGLGVNDINDGGALDFSNYGVKLSGGDLTFGPGTLVQGFRILTANADVFNFAGVEISNNRFLINSTNNIQISTGFGFAKVKNNLFIKVTSSAAVINDYWQSKFIGNTFITRGAATEFRLFGGYGGVAEVRDNVFFNCGTTPVTDPNGYVTNLITNNYTNVVPTNTKGMVVNTNSSLFFKNASTDYRPIDGGILLGAATASQISTADIRGKNRGPTPDVGSVQLNAYIPVPTLTITSTVVDGQTVTISGTITNSATSGIATLNPAATPNGATQISSAITITGSTFSVVFADIDPGNYLSPVITAINVGGMSTPASGAAPISILTITGNPTASGANGFPVAVISSQVITFRDLTVSGTFTGTALSGTATLTASGNGAVSVAEKPITITGNTFTVTWTNLAVGTYNAPVISLLNNVGSSNASGGTTVVATQKPPVCTVISATIAGGSIIASGTVDFFNPTTSSLIAYLDKTTGGTTGPTSITVSGNSWTHTFVPTTAGAFVVRVIATNNGGNVTSSGTSLNFLSLSGTVNLPIG